MVRTRSNKSTTSPNVGRLFEVSLKKDGIISGLSQKPHLAVVCNKVDFQTPVKVKVVNEVSQSPTEPEIQELPTTSLKEATPPITIITIDEEADLHGQLSENDFEKESIPVPKAAKRRVIKFPTEVSKIPEDIMLMTFGRNSKLPEGYFDVTTGKEYQEPNKVTTTSAMVGSTRIESVITPDFERNSAPVEEKSWRNKIKERKEVRKMTAGKNWFNIKPPELTDEVKRDLEILQMRNILDPKRFYKHNDRQAIPKYFQVGHIMDNAADFYSSRVPKKQRKKNLAEELLQDAAFQQYRKRKCNELAMQKKLDGVKQRRFKKRKHSSNNTKLTRVTEQS